MGETKHIGKPLIKVKKKRAWELDFMRGLAVILMCFDHAMFDLSHPNSFFSNFYEVENSFAEWLYELAKAYWNSGSSSVAGLRFWGHYIFVFVFLFLVGTSCAFSRDNSRRGAICGLAALAFTGISYVLKAMGMMSYGIVFGILHCIALSILCVAAVDVLTSWNKHVNMFVPLIIGAVIMAVGISKQFWITSYDRVFTDSHFTGYIMGTHSFGDDWFGLFPYVGMVFIGTFWGKAAYPERKSLLPMLDGKWHKPITFVGRRAIFFYFLHQPVIAGIIMLIGLCMGYAF